MEGCLLYQCGRCMKVGDIFADKKLKGKGNNAVYKHQRSMPLHAPRFVIPAISPHFPFFPRYPSVSHDIPRHPSTSLDIPRYPTLQGYLFQHGGWKNTSAAKLWHPQSESAKTLYRGIPPHPYTCHLVHSPFLLQLHSPPQPILPALLPSNPQVPPIFTHFPAPHSLSLPVPPYWQACLQLHGCSF